MWIWVEMSFQVLNFEMKSPHVAWWTNTLVNIPPWKLTYPLKNDGQKMYFLLKLSLFWGHVNFQGCTPGTYQNDTGKPQTVYVEGIPESPERVAWGMLQGYVGVLLEWLKAIPSSNFLQNLTCKGHQNDFSRVKQNSLPLISGWKKTLFSAIYKGWIRLFFISSRGPSCTGWWYFCLFCHTPWNEGI